MGRVFTCRQNLLYNYWHFFLSIYLILFVRSFVVKDYKNIGNLIINKENIKLTLNKEEQTFAFLELDSLVVESNENASLSATRMTNKSGINNNVKFIIDGHSFEYQFYLENQTQSDFLHRFLTDLKINDEKTVTSCKETIKGIVFTMKKMPTANSC